MVINKTRPVIIIGFTAVLLIFMVLVMVWVGSQHAQHKRLVELDTLRQAARSLSDMRKVSLRRVLALHEMSLISDPFDLEEKYEAFSNLAGAFITAREKLMALDLDEKTLSLWEEIRLKVVASQQVQAQTLQWLMTDSRKRGIALLRNEVVPRQQEIMDVLSEMFEYHNQQVARKFADADLHQRRTYGIITVLTLLALFISSAIIFYVVKTTSRIHNDLRKADEARIANRMKSEFLANMSHEIRTPLTSIIGYAEAALHPGQSRHERMEGIDTIHRNGLHLLSLINDILDLSKVEAGKLEVEKLPVSVFEILHDVGNVASGRIKEKHLQYGLNYKFPLPATIQTDPLRLRQILVNLVNNAIKFTDKGYVYVTVWCDRNQSRMCFAVEDSGIGISEQECEKIFESFTQADRSTTRRYGGTGLGLSLSRQLAQKLGGDIQVSSKPGVGSTFTVSIDCGALADDNIVYEPPRVSGPDDSNAIPEMPILKGRVLLVEDVEDNQKLVSFFIHKTGAQVDVACNGQQALEMLELSAYDLVLMDMQMPVMDGVEATRQIRRRKLDVPVYMLTANAYPEDRKRCEQAGANGFLSKPVSNQHINEVLVQYLQACQQTVFMNEPIYSSLLQTDPGLQEIVTRFVCLLPEQIAALEAAHARQDWCTVCDQVHDLKGTAGNMGFAEIYSQAADIERHIKNRQYDRVAEGLDILRGLADRVNPAGPARQQQDSEPLLQQPRSLP